MFFRGKKKVSGSGEIAAEIEQAEVTTDAADTTGTRTNRAKPGKNQTRSKTKSKKKKRILIGGIILVVILAVIFVPKMLAGDPPPTQVSTGTVEKADVEEAVTIKGTIEGSASANVASSVASQVTSIRVKEGDIVAKNQILATLDTEDMQREYQKAAKTLADSKFAYDSARQLYEQGAMSEKDYINAKNAYEGDQLNLQSYNVADKTNIKSPIAGTVTRVNISIGQYANDMKDSEPMFVVEDLANLKMNVKISEYDISKIKVGQTVTITAEMLGDQNVTGVVSQISPTGELKDTSSTEMVIPVKIDVNKGTSNLIAGVTAKARIQIRKSVNVIALPIDAVMQDPSTGKSYVMKVQKGVLKKVPVTTGVEGDFTVEMLSGNLKKGDQVVLSPTFDLTDGMNVLAVPQ